jgi:hypothetical protein
MLKMFAAIGLVTSIGFAPVLLAPIDAMAQPAPPPIRAASAIKPATVIPEATAKARECARDADAKGLKGKPRKKFLSQCKKGGSAPF